MSTTINVTVDDGGLPARNRQQTAANRQAFVQGQASQQAAQQGADQRAADRRAAGLDPATGRPLATAGGSSRLQRIEQEPAANRKGGDVWVMYFRSEPTFEDITPSGAVIKDFSATGAVINNNRLVASQPFYSYADTGSQFFPQTNPLSFIAGGGPGGSSIIRSKTNLTMAAGDPRFSGLPEDTYITLRKPSYALTLESDVRFTGPSDFPYSYTLGATFFVSPNGIPSAVAGGSISFDPIGQATTIAINVSSATSPSPSSVVINGSSLLNDWSRIAFTYDLQVARLFIDGQLLLSANFAPPEPSPSFLQFDASVPDYGVNTSAAYVDFTGVVFTPRALYAANYTPQPLRF